MSVQQPKALRLADELDTEFAQHRTIICNRREAATELRRLHAENEALKAQRKPLTDDELDVIWAKQLQTPFKTHGEDRMSVARAIEAAHGIK